MIDFDKGKTIFYYNGKFNLNGGGFYVRTYIENIAFQKGFTPVQKKLFFQDITYLDTLIKKLNTKYQMSGSFLHSNGRYH